jgi:hypothetical protein
MYEEVWARFDAGDAEGVYSLFSDESKKLLDHDQFVAKLTAAWRIANALPPDAAVARSRSASGKRKRSNWSVYIGQKYEVLSVHTTLSGEIQERVVFDLSSGRRELYRLDLGFSDAHRADNISAPAFHCTPSDANCPYSNGPLPRPWL